MKIKGGLGGQINELKGDIKEIGGKIKEIKRNVDDLFENNDEFLGIFNDHESRIEHLELQSEISTAS